MCSLFLYRLFCFFLTHSTSLENIYYIFVISIFQCSLLNLNKLKKLLFSQLHSNEKSISNVDRAPRPVTFFNVPPSILRVCRVREELRGSQEVVMKIRAGVGGGGVHPCRPWICQLTTQLQRRVITYL